MKRHPLILLLLSAVSVYAAAESKPVSTLRWRNGESLPGEILGASNTDLTWKTPLFEDPLVLNWQALSRIESTQAAALPREAFAVSLRDGSRIYANLVSLNEDSLLIHSGRHGDALLKRAEVLSVRRLHGANLLSAGPTGVPGWDNSGGRNKSPNKVRSQTAAPGVSALITGPGGAMTIPAWNQSAFYDLALPELVDVEFRVHSSARLDLALALEGTGKDRLRIESWEEDLVLVASNEFKKFGTIAADQRQLALRVCWERKSRKCAVYTPGGELLVEWQVPEDAVTGGSGLLLQNKGRDLSLDFLRVRTWDGNPPAKYDPAKPRIELADGRILEGSAASVSAQSVVFRAAGPELTLALDEIDAIYFSADSPPAVSNKASLAYADGTLIMGRVRSMNSGWLGLATSFCKEALAAQVDGLTKLLIDEPAVAGAAPEPALDQLDQLIVGKTILHGRLAAAGDRLPRWLAVGGVKPSTPAKSGAFEILRAFPPDTEFPLAPALFYTNSNEILPGHFRSLTSTSAEIESSIIEAAQLPVESLQAVQFGGVSQSNLKGFSEEGWRICKGEEKAVHREGNNIKLEAGTALGHPTALQASEINFSISASGFSALRLRLFCQGTEPAKSTNLILMVSGNRTYVGVEASEGQMENQTPSANFRPNTPIGVRLVLADRDVEVYINGQLNQTLPLAAGSRAGSGLIIEPAGMWGNSVRPVTLSDFSARSLPGNIRMPEISAETKTQALSVPRFKKDTPPRHALLAANGDVLRGEVEAATAEHLGFLTGLEKLRIPRSRVRALIWLKKPDANAVVQKSELPKEFEQPIKRRTRYGQVGFRSLISLLQQEAPSLKFKFPTGEIGGQFAMQFGGQTIGQALDQICNLFGLKYRIEASGVITFETPAKGAAEQTEKVYWLKPGALGPSPQPSFAAKGVEFPAGAAVRWNSNSGQLSVTNTAANHQKLDAVLEKDFGGTLGSPTHWLLLTSGARLHLEVEKFEDGFISGRNPLYGHTRVPVSEISALRTEAPAATPAMKALEDWRLVYAQEPVLPETAGESSPTLGKAAKTFKLPLLAGGEFDLANQKGQVVVLDFWATWCGPCIKSLPGLIEAMAAFPADKVKLYGVNQGEPAAQVKRFLETRGLQLTVLLDGAQSVARNYGVEGIPHTVIIGPDGNIAWVKTGYSPEGAKEAAEAVKRLLQAPAAAPK